MKLRPATTVAPQPKVDQPDELFVTLRAERPGASPVEAMGMMAVDSRKELEVSGSGHCVGLSSLLVDQLAEQGIAAFSTPVELTAGLRPAGGAQFGHVAVIAPYEGGVVLLDPGLALHEPVVLPDGGTVELTRGKTTYRYSWEDRADGTRAIKGEQVKPPSNGEYATYLMARIDNMDASCTHALELRGDSFRLAGHSTDAKLTAQLTVQPESRQVSLSAGGPRLKVSYDELPKLEQALAAAGATPEPEDAESDDLFAQLVARPRSKK